MLKDLDLYLVLALGGALLFGLLSTGAHRILPAWAYFLFGVVLLVIYVGLKVVKEENEQQNRQSGD